MEIPLQIWNSIKCKTPVKTLQEWHQTPFCQHRDASGTFRVPSPRGPHISSAVYPWDWGMSLSLTELLTPSTPTFFCWDWLNHKPRDEAGLWGSCSDIHGLSWCPQGKDPQCPPSHSKSFIKLVALSVPSCPLGVSRNPWCPPPPQQVPHSVSAQGPFMAGRVL